MQPKVSVIVPVYNVAPYLRRCLDSLLSQSLRELEILLIDDGSTDSSGIICDAYAQKDSRIRVIHQENAGLSEARNKGISLARAPYLMFVDSDDWVKQEYCGIPYSLAESNGADLIMFNAFGKYGRIRYAFPQDGTEKLLSSEQVLRQLPCFSAAVWNKCYRAELFRSIRFPSGKCYEDIGTTHRLIHQAKKIFVTNMPLYHHCLRNGSISQTHSKKNDTDRFEMDYQRVQDLCHWGYDETAERFRMSLALKYLIAMGEKEKNSAECRDILKQAPRNYPFKPFRRKVLFRLYRFSPPLFHIVCILFMKRSA